RISKDGIEWKPLAIDPDDKEALPHQQSGVWTGEEFIVSGKYCVYRSKDGTAWTKTKVKKGYPSLKSAHQQLVVGSLWPTGFTLSRDGGENWGKESSAISVYRI